MESRTASTSSNSNGSEKSRRRNTDYLQIDPSSTFMNNTNRGYTEELPENFLDTISPHPVAPSVSSSSETTESTATEEVPTSVAPQLASLAPMSINTEQPSSSFSSISSSYITVKNEPENDFRFSGSTAGLLSPLQVDEETRRNSHDFNTSPYIKEEEDIDNTHLLMGSLQESELDQLGDRTDSPQHEQSGELASISSLLSGGGRDTTPSPQFGADPTPMIQRQLIKNEDEVAGGATAITFSRPARVPYPKVRQNGGTVDFEKTPYQRNSRKQKKPLGVLNQTAASSLVGANNSTEAAVPAVIPTPPPVQARRIYSTHDSNDPLNAEIGDDIYIDTKDLCKRIAFELKNHSIPQAIFAERILCRSQGTLSDLLRNPKPWNKLKSGRETFRRMYNWVAQPLATRLAILDMKTDDANRPTGMSPPTPAQNVRTHRKSTSDPDGPVSKRPRLVFTDIQKRTLQAIFKETQRPSREMQQTIAEHLRLDLSTVANFFMNARRRSRLGVNIDEPTPYQQVRNITPPPGMADNIMSDHGSEMINSVMEDMYKDEHAADISAEQHQLVERGFGVPVGGPSHSHSVAVHIHDHDNGESQEEDEDEGDELNDDELAYEEDVDVGEDEDEEEEVEANGDTLPKEELDGKASIKEEVPDDGEYGAAAKTAAASR